jgi:hypothetical protein
VEEQGSDGSASCVILNAETGRAAELNWACNFPLLAEMAINIQ